MEVNELHSKMCFRKREILLLRKGENFIREGLDEVMEDITAEDITLRVRWSWFCPSQDGGSRNGAFEIFHSTSFSFFATRGCTYFFVF